MAIYHLEAKIISRGAGRSAIAAAAYQSGEKLYNAYDGLTHDYRKKGGILHTEILLPPQAPAAWKERQILWEAVETAEKTRDSRLARQLIVALPVELAQEDWLRLLRSFLQKECVDQGMCADLAIHDPDGHNPHAHILLTMRPLNTQGQWQAKTQKEYLCSKAGQEQGFTAQEFLQAKMEGWEKQYKYKNPQGRTAWLTPSQAVQNPEWVRCSKQPKAAKFGRQNPLCARWNSQEQLLRWRCAWTEAVNHALEEKQQTARVAHLSHAAQGIAEQPTIHEGYHARKLEKQGISADRCELNRQIRADNILLRKLKSQVEKLAKAVNNTLPALAETMENLRCNMLLFCYQLGHLQKGKRRLRASLDTLRPISAKYEQIEKEIQETTKERQSLICEKKALSATHIFRHRKLATKMAVLTEDLEELYSEKKFLLASLKYTEKNAPEEFSKSVAAIEKNLKRLEEQEKKYSAELDAALDEYAMLRGQAQNLEQMQLYTIRQSIRPGKEQKTEKRVQELYGEKYNPLLMYNSKKAVARLLNENAERQAVRRMIWQSQKKAEILYKKNCKEQER